MMGVYASMMICSLATLALSGYLYMITMTKDMMRLLEDLNKNATAKKYRSRVLKQLCEFIEFHSDVTQLRMIMASTYSFNSSIFLCSI